MSPRALTIALFAVAAVAGMAWWQSYITARYLGAPILPKSGPITA